MSWCLWEEADSHNGKRMGQATDPIMGFPTLPSKQEKSRRKPRKQQGLSLPPTA